LCSPDRGPSASSPATAYSRAPQIARPPRDDERPRLRGATETLRYLRLREKTTEVETIRISDALNVDVAPDGTVDGIELLNANEQFQASDNGTLVVINEAVGERQQIPLTRT
jgi:uncharacterized protein YuzE